MIPAFIDAVGIIMPGAGDAAGSVGLIYTETQNRSELPRVGVRTPMLMGGTAPLPPEVMGANRLVELGGRAVFQAVDEELASAKIALVVCTPTGTDEPELGQAGDFLARLAAEAQVDLAPRSSRVFASGRDAIFEALPFALSALAEPDLGAVCVLGVDSLVTKPRLRRFIERGEGGLAGLPSLGEGAAALLLTRRPRPHALASLAGLGVASQPVAPGMPAQGLLAAMNQALASTQPVQPAFAGLVHDMAGSETEAEELAWAKTSTVFSSSPHIEAIYPCVAAGDTGAAMGVLAIATAAYLIDKRAWMGMSMCCLSSPARRGVALLAPLSTVPPR
jgi:hypothetical protein